jgi:hypothetical protein
MGNGVILALGALVAFTHSIGSSMSSVGGGERPFGDRQTDARFAVVLITRNRQDELLHSLERMTSLPELPWVVREDDAVPPEVEYGLRLLEEHSAGP